MISNDKYRLDFSVTHLQTAVCNRCTLTPAVLLEHAHHSHRVMRVLADSEQPKAFAGQDTTILQSNCDSTVLQVCKRMHSESTHKQHQSCAVCSILPRLQYKSEVCKCRLENFQFIYLIQPRLSMDPCPCSENPGISHLPSTTSSTVAVLSCMLTTVPAILAAVPAVLAPVAAIAAVARVNRRSRRSRSRGGGGGGGAGGGRETTPVRTCSGDVDIHTAGGT